MHVLILDEHTDALPVRGIYKCTSTARLVIYSATHHQSYLPTLSNPVPTCEARVSDLHQVIKILVAALPPCTKVHQKFQGLVPRTEARVGLGKVSARRKKNFFPKRLEKA